MITENYIKMCEQTEEIQKAWKPKLLDKVITKRTLTDNNYSQDAISYIKDFEHPYDEYYYTNYEHIWLPTLEQLFEMVGEIKKYKQNIKDMNWYMIFNDIEEFTEECWKFYSVQEIILAFVMYEKYSKVWISETWEVTNE